MSNYINCPQCGEEMFDTDTLRCDCGYYDGQHEESLNATIHNLIIEGDKKDARIRELEQLITQFEKEWPCDPDNVADAEHAVLMEAYKIKARKDGK